ncbi:C40 family peptidase [Flammeovirga kamogawensis]|uniref:C40 family peptidase n=1 Tax=Flammeovirga kamogawensis TaxID=373891 RepID=A0ABX8GU38_9BACT|nr:C40 family peptidase [Flammeovirga kamogawensis]MBB6460080.1 cell wall-associated NlpC family hydrolase [Flammeovirga kamogawensis]QWG06876.1 C40 family peptidase [Flammeovirga kamogawensis]
MKKSTVFISLLFFTLVTTVLQSCQYGKNYTYSTRQDKLQQKKQQRVAELGGTTTPSQQQGTTTASQVAAAPVKTPKNVSNKVQAALKTAWTYEGVKYDYGNMSKKGIDCSGLMCVSWQAANVTLPRASYQQAKEGKYVPFSNLKPGDLVFFSGPGTSNIKHVGMISAVKNGKKYFIHASTSHGVMQSELSDVYWKKYYKLARRLD